MTEVGGDIPGPQQVTQQEPFVLRGSLVGALTD
jgi:hypothetical protein